MWCCGRCCRCSVRCCGCSCSTGSCTCSCVLGWLRYVFSVGGVLGILGALCRSGARAPLHCKALTWDQCPVTMLPLLPQFRGLIGKLGGATPPCPWTVVVTMLVGGGCLPVLQLLVLVWVSPCFRISVFAGMVVEHCKCCAPWRLRKTAFETALVLRIQVRRLHALR